MASAANRAGQANAERLDRILQRPPELLEESLSLDVDQARQLIGA